MQDIQERSDSIASRLSDLRLLNQGVVEQRYRILLFFVRITASLAAFGFLPGCCSGNVEPHLDELILPGGCLLALTRRRTILAARLATIANGKLDRDFVSPSEVCVRDF